ncbi:MAG: acetate--CoA ligase family protein [Candidatus Palauibacterales bacterium]|nr:acetate--CoA ligase family protein [Candidatus Palauibacterales bacterium]
MTHPLQPILEPRSVAVIGSSSNPRKRGYQAVRALLDARYEGEIHPVNPSGGELLGLAVATSVDALAATPDLALVCTPAESVPAVLESCARRGIPGAVVLAVGFRESGAAGAALEDQIMNIARRTGIRVVGPNTSGILNTTIGLNLVGVRDVPKGRLAIVSQSGNVGLALMLQAAARSQGVSVYVGVGNETDVAIHEYLDYLGSADHTSAILMYIEGFQKGERFIEVARRVSLQKPIALLKGGRSGGGDAAARSHTGAIAGSALVLRSALKAAGVHLVERSDELLAIGETLASQPPVRSGSGVVVLSDGGGYATLAADLLSEQGVKMASLSEATRTVLRSLLGRAASVDNPVDVAGAGDQNPEVFARAIETIFADPATGGVLMAGLFGGYAIRFSEELAAVESEAATTIAAVAARARLPLVVQSLYATAHSEPLRRLGRASVPVVESLETAAACIKAAYERGVFLSGAAIRVRPSPPAPRGEEPVTIAKAREERRVALNEVEARSLAVESGVEVAPASFCETAEEVGAAIERTRAPVAIKVVSPSILHKSEAGGVALDVKDAREGAAAFRHVVESATAYARDRGISPDILGVLVVPMLPMPVAELIVGARRDPQFGPVITVGAGGVAVELLGDAALRPLPISVEDALDMLGDLRLAPVLSGYRGQPSASKDALVEVMLGVAKCFLANPQLSELELNPVFAYEERATAVDVRGLLLDVGSLSAS